MEDKGEYQSKYGQTAIGILVMQDIFAVVFLAASTGKLPSVWAIGLLVLLPLRYVLMGLLDRAGHNGVLQILYGIAMAFGGYTLFDTVDVKGDLGALIMWAMLASLTLANYSEFGLMVGTIAVSNAWLTEDWLVTIALALTLTIIIAAPINMRAVRFYNRFRPTARKFETALVLPEDELADLSNVKIAVVGMGKLGTSVYDQLWDDYGDVLIGIDNDPDIIAMHKAAGRKVVNADAIDDEIWERVSITSIEVGILALKRYQENLGLLKRVRTQFISKSVCHRTPRR